jgi:putative flavoprotein involved in K+ transport
MPDSYDVVVIGGGQAGLTMSRALLERGIEHVVLERDRVGERWRTSRWDSLMFQFPNDVLSLPGMPYDGPDPDGFSHYSVVVDLLERYADLIGVPVREHTQVTSVDRAGDRWRVTTASGEVLLGRVVVVATGPFPSARLPELAGRLPARLHQLHSVEYRNPEDLPDGGVLVVGSGASGSQIAEELAGAGRSTYLCLSRHRRVPRRHLGRDIFRWLVELGMMDRTRADWVDGRMPPTVLVTGVGGGHDMDVRTLGQQGIGLFGSLRGSDGAVLRLGDDAEPILAAADTMHDELVRAIDDHAREAGLDVPDRVPEPRPGPVPARASLDLDRAGISTVLWATGYAFDYGWLHASCFADSGEPLQRRGVTDVPGLYFLGLHWMHTFKSGTFLGIGEDAEHVAEHLVGHLRSPHPG